MGAKNLPVPSPRPMVLLADSMSVILDCNVVELKDMSVLDVRVGIAGIKGRLRAARGGVM